MTDRDIEIDRLIEQFLVDNPEPTTDDWKRLIEGYPEFAGDIADAAMIRRSSPQLSEAPVSDLPSDDALFNETISHVLNMVHDAPSDVLQKGKARVAAILGPSTRKMAEEIGIGPYPSLLNGILVGRTMAPVRVLKALESRLEVPMLVLSELFRRVFAESEVPAYKAIGVKPHVYAQPRTWEEAVKELNLSPTETTRLMKFAETTDL